MGDLEEPQDLLFREGRDIGAGEHLTRILSQL